MQPYLQDYRPFDRIEFPFIIAVIGPTASGRTTVCQFLQKAFDLHVIECHRLPPDPKPGSKSGKSPADSIIESPPDDFISEDYPLADSISVRYRDDKDVTSQLISIIKARQPDEKGFAISGYPTNRKQLTSLEKALLQAKAHTHDLLLRFQQLLSARGRAQLTAINGAIFTVYADPNPERLVDPETGCVYKKGFHMPGFADLIGVQPREFVAAKRAIDARLYSYVADDYATLGAKGQQQWSQFEQQTRKSMPTVSVGVCDSALQLLQGLDGFVADLYRKNPQYLPVASPMAALLRPQALLRPGRCFGAVRTWYGCLEAFGRPIADRSRLVSTFASKLHLLTTAAAERYQLLISRRDARLRICREFVRAREGDPSAHFRRIWELSIAVRNENFEVVDGIIDKSGLIELLMELRKSSKIVFVALVHRLMYVRWFAERFAPLVAAESLDASASIEKFEMIMNVEIPPVEYSSAASGVSDGSATFEYLVQGLQVHTERVADAIAFDAGRACADLGIPEFRGPDFNETVPFADAFFAYLEAALSDRLLKQEAKSSREIFRQFTTRCHQKELSMVNSVCDLRDSLRKFAYSKCTHEMELFSERFRALKKGMQFEGEPFEFDTRSVNLRVRPLAESAVLLTTPIVIQSLVSFDSIVALANTFCESGTKYSSDDEFLSTAKSIGLDDNEIEQIELCLRVLECVKCFDVRKFLSCFPKTREEEALLSRVFTQKRIPNPLVSISHSTIASIPGEEEDSDSASTFESARTSPLLATT